MGIVNHGLARLRTAGKIDGDKMLVLLSLACLITISI